MSSATELSTWLNGTPTGGPNGDGRYPLTYQDGNTYLVYCPAAQALNPSLAEQPIEVFANTASAAAISATGSADVATQAKIDAQTAAANAAASAATTTTHKNAAATSATSAAASATAADTSATNAAASAALADADRIAAEAARDDAEAAAASVNPTNYYDKITSDARFMAVPDTTSALALDNDYADIPKHLTITNYGAADASVPVGFAVLVTLNDMDNRVAQFAIGSHSSEFFWRGHRTLDGGWQAWRKLWHDGNLADPVTQSGTQIISGAKTFSATATFGGEILGEAGATSLNIRQPTSDGADTARLALAGGATYSNSRGAYMLLHGNEYASSPGLALMASGINSDVRIIASGTGVLKLESATGGVNSNGEIAVTAANAFRTVQGNYGSFWRNDGASLYLMVTASGDQYGSWNSLRPIYFSLTSGRATMENGATLLGGISVNAATDGGAAQGIRHWSATSSAWATYMAQAGASKSHKGGTACASLSGRTGYHLRSRGSNNTGNTQGFIWENDDDVALMSLDGDTGDLYAKGSCKSVLGHFNAVGTAAVLSAEAGGLGVFLRPAGRSVDNYAVRATADGYLVGHDAAGTGRPLLQYSDSWLRLNPSAGFTSGIYWGSGLLRGDGPLQVGTTNANGFYTSPSQRPLFQNQHLIINKGGVDNIQKMTQAAYDALGTKDANTLYIIVG